MDYDVLAREYDRFNAGFDYAEYLAKILPHLRDLPENPLALDCGCGTGTLMLALSRKGFDCSGVDLSPEMLQEVLDEHYGGDFESFAEEYFDLVSDVVNKTNCDIIGHLDVISKFFERKPRFLTDRYKNAALNAVRKLIPYNRFFEINVGAMTRGCRTSPYPAEFILKEINRLGGRIVINGDCHEKERLGDFLEDAAILAKKCGFSERWLLTENGWVAEEI
jgi:histidinol-phosphatase (PHP family)